MGQDLTGFTRSGRLGLNLLLGRCFEQQFSSKYLSGLVIVRIAVGIEFYHDLW